MHMRIIPVHGIYQHKHRKEERMNNVFKGTKVKTRRWKVGSVINMSIKGCYVHNKQCSPPNMNY